MFRILLLLLMFATPPAYAADAQIIVQRSPLAGFQYYSGKALWDEIKVGDALTLTREPDNTHDANAVIVSWKGQRLGYVPRRENSDVARQMDRGAPVKARIVRLLPSRNPWQRIEFEIYVVCK